MSLSAEQVLEKVKTLGVVLTFITEASKEIDAKYPLEKAAAKKIINLLDETYPIAEYRDCEGVSQQGIAEIFDRFCPTDCMTESGDMDEVFMSYIAKAFKTIELLAIALHKGDK